MQKKIKTMFNTVLPILRNKYLITTKLHKKTERRKCHVVQLTSETVSNYTCF